MPGRWAPDLLDHVRRNGVPLSPLEEADELAEHVKLRTPVLIHRHLLAEGLRGTEHLHNNLADKLWRWASPPPPKSCGGPSDSDGAGTATEDFDRRAMGACGEENRGPAQEVGVERVSVILVRTGAGLRTSVYDVTRGGVMIRILLVDDHALVRNALSNLLSAEDDIEVVGETGSGHEAVALCRDLEPDVVVLDYSLPDLDGLETTRQIVDLELRTRILVLTMHASEEYATRLIRAGATGFVVKAASTDELLVGIRKVAQKGVYVTPSVLERMVERMGQPESETPESLLSNRELQVLVRLARGAKTREVSKELSLSQSTVETYRARVLEKLGLRNTSDLTRFAIRRGLIELD